jgi:hypothetical protein
MTIRAGARERAVRADLRGLPESMRKGAIASTALMLARLLDHGICEAYLDETGMEEHLMHTIPAKEIPAFAREIRQCITVLQEQGTGEVPGDETDEIKGRREKRGLAVIPG